MVAANAMMVHRALVYFTRRRIADGGDARRLRDLRAQAEPALALSSRALAGYAPAAI